MTQELMERIHALANERFNLYRAAGRNQLSITQMNRLHELDTLLPQIWDEYRRELAGQQRPEQRSFLNVA